MEIMLMLGGAWVALAGLVTVALSRASHDDPGFEVEKSSPGLTLV